MTLRFRDYRTVITTKNPHADWGKAIDRLAPEAWPVIQPTFSLKAGDTILTIGSCFARSIEGYLAKNGFRVPSLSLGMFGEASLLNKYTPPSIDQEVSWAANIYRRDDKLRESDCQQFAYRLRNETIIDNNLADFQPVPADLFFARRQRIYQIFREAFTADCIVLTPGLAEAWFDKERNIFIQQALTGHHSDISRNLQFTMLNFASCYHHLDHTISEIQSLNAKAKFLITTSPIPLAHTFTNEDIIIANTHAKSVLRAACGEIAANRDGVDYFPSFENVTLTRGRNVFAADNLHIVADFVKKIMERVLEAYYPELNRSVDRRDENTIDPPLKAAMTAQDFDEAARILDEIIAKNPSNSKSWFALSTVHDRRGDYDAAIHCFDKAIDSYVASGDTSFPQHLEPDAKLIFRLKLYRRLQDSEKERGALVEISQLRPENAQIQFQIANMYWSAGKIPESEPYFIRAWELGTYNPLAAGTSLAIAWCHLGKAGKAIGILETMTGEWGGNTGVWTELGNACLIVGDTTKAEMAFNKAVEIDSNNENARYNLNQLRSQRGA